MSLMKIVDANKDLQDTKVNIDESVDVAVVGSLANHVKLLIIS